MNDINKPVTEDERIIFEIYHKLLNFFEKEIRILDKNNRIDDSNFVDIVLKSSMSFLIFIRNVKQSNKIFELEFHLNSFKKDIIDNFKVMLDENVK